MDLPELSPEQEAVVAAIENTRDHIFVTGRAGTGKSTLLEYLSWHSSHTLAICAPTGVAALNVGGQTIHSLFRLPIGVIADHDIDQPPEPHKRCRWYTPLTRSIEEHPGRFGSSRSVAC